MAASDVGFPKPAKGLVPVEAAPNGDVAGLFDPSDPKKLVLDGAEDAAAVAPPRETPEPDDEADAVGVEPNRVGLCCG